MIRKMIHQGDLIPAWYGMAYRQWDTDRVICYPIPLHWIVSALVLVRAWSRQGIRLALSPVPETRTYQHGYDRGFADCAHGALLERRDLERQITAAHDKILALRILLVSPK